MTTSKPTLKLLVASLCFTAAQADTVRLTTGDTLTGEIQSLDAAGLTLKSPLSPNPLQIKADHIFRAEFSESSAAQASKEAVHPEIIVLSNGDQLPCQLQEITEQTVRFSTRYAGEFNIPREEVRMLHFGITKERTHFSAQNKIEGWTTKDGTWYMDDGAIACSGNGRLARELKLPETVRFQYNFAWKNTPKFAFRFCAENNRATTKQNCYELLFNSAGMLIRRYADANQPSAVIANLSQFTPPSFKDKNVLIDIRVDRRTNRVSLSLDGIEIGSWPDHFENTAKGNFIVFKSSISKGTGCMISKFRITDGATGSSVVTGLTSQLGTSHKHDMLVDTEAEQVTGKILNFKGKQAGKRTLNFFKPEGDTTFTVPERKISTLVFKQGDEKKQNSAHTLRASLKGGGSITLLAPTVNKKHILSTHPILGKVSIKAATLKHLENPKAAQALDAASKTLSKDHSATAEELLERELRHRILIK